MRIICVTNQKGGVGKTTTADALCAYLRKHKKARVLAVDLDPQCNLTAAYGENPSNVLLSVSRGRRLTVNAVRRSERGDILTGCSETLEMQSDDVNAALDSFSGEYDFAVLDTPPSLSSVTVSALMASTAVVVPTSADIFGLSGLDALHQTVSAVQSATGGRPVWSGVILTKHNPRTNIGKLAQGRLIQWTEQKGIPLCETAIRDCISIREAQALGKDIFTHAPRCAAAKDYSAAFESIYYRL